MPLMEGLEPLTLEFKSHALLTELAIFVYKGGQVLCVAKAPDKNSYVGSEMYVKAFRGLAAKLNLFCKMR